MSEEPTDSDHDLPRRAFMKATGAAAGAGVFGLGASNSALAAHESVADRYYNWRTVEASKVWDRGYRGRPERSVALTDSGVESRHPDLGPWNGVDIKETDEGYVLQSIETGDDPTTTNEVSASGTLGPGSADAGQTSQASTEFEPKGGDLVIATLSWDQGQSAQDVDFRLEDAEGNVVAKSETFQGPEKIRSVLPPDAPTPFRLVAYTYLSGPTTYEISGRVIDADIAFGDVSNPLVGTDGDPAAKTVGWYGSQEQPLDGNGHGTHVASIMTGSGRGSVVDEAATQVEEPEAILVAGDVLTYEVDAEAGTGVFGSAFGENIEVVVEAPDGETLDKSDFQSDDDTEIDDRSAFGTHVVAEAPTVHDSGTETYSVFVRPHSGTVVSPGRVRSVAAGPFETPASTDGDRTGSGIASFHSGVAPNASLVGFQGLSGATGFLANNAKGLTSDFNLRAVNMSWGIVGGVPLGTAGSNLPLSGNTASHILDIAKAGVLTVAAAGNSNTPANTSIPAAAEEAVSVVATDELDGIVDYSSGGLVALDEDQNRTYMKPDVTAPGGGSTDLINAADTGDPDRPESGQSPIRDYTEKAGTSMASPYTCGVAGLVAEAMEFDAPDSVALPEPAEAGFDDVMRLKQVILATATETAFTAAPHHKAHVPTYDHGGRDPYEGFGRVNPDAAVDAVTNDLFDATSPALEVEDAPAVTPLETDDDEGTPASVSTTLSGDVGLNVPFDGRALAGYVEAKGGTLEAAVDATGISGGNSGMAKGTPHVDLFVYDAESPNLHGEPNIVASDMGVQGSASVSVDVEAREFESDEPNTRTFYVVAKLVNVPGVATGFDVQVDLDLSLGFEAADVPVEPPEQVNLNAGGSRSDDGSVFTAGQTDEVSVTIESFNEALTDEVRIVDQSPWDVEEAFGDVESYDPETGEVDLGTVSHSELPVTRTYFAEAPDTTGRYTFGAAEAEAVEPDGFGDDPDKEQGSTEESFGGTDTNTVVGASTET